MLCRYIEQINGLRVNFCIKFLLCGPVDLTNRISQQEALMKRQLVMMTPFGYKEFKSKAGAGNFRIALMSHPFLSSLFNSS